MLTPVRCIVVLAALAGAVRADSVGVVATGDPDSQVHVVRQAEAWLEKHGHQLGASPLEPSAINTLEQCVMIDDAQCGRQVVEKRSKTDGVVFIRIGVGSAPEGKQITLTAYWLVKGMNAIATRHICNDCSQATLLGATDAVMTSLASQLARGRLHIASEPSGVIVMLDNTKIGVTPLAHDVAPGVHTITLIRAGVAVGSRSVTVNAGGTVEVTIPVVIPPAERDEEPSQTLPIALVVGGGVALAGGGAALYLGERDGEDVKTIYPEATPIGIGLVAAGAVGVAVGAVLWRRASHDSTPVAVFAADTAIVGWSGRW